MENTPTELLEQNLLRGPRDGNHNWRRRGHQDPEKSTPDIHAMIAFRLRVALLSRKCSRRIW